MPLTKSSVPPNDSISTKKIQDESVTNEKILSVDASKITGLNGGGADIKSGQSTGAKAEVVQVDYLNPFTSIPQVCLTPSSTVIVKLIEKTTSYFKWTNNSKSADVTIDWIATDADNP